MPTKNSESLGLVSGNGCVFIPATPLLCANNLSLAGATTDSPQGTDFVLMKERN